jgi:hypothetical protein
MCCLSREKWRLPLLPLAVAVARVERTLLSAAFDFAFVLELKEHAPLSATVEERCFSAA